MPGAIEGWLYICLLWDSIADHRYSKLCGEFYSVHPAGSMYLAKGHWSQSPHAGIKIRLLSTGRAGSFN